jgi:hypothetical protein
MGHFLHWHLQGNKVKWFAPASGEGSATGSPGTARRKSASKFIGWKIDFFERLTGLK